MNREILQACTPCLIALAIAFVVLWCVVKVSGARINLRRLRELHRCQDGGVQSLSFVITLPLFIMIVMFIVQVSQLMVGITVVHYSAYAAARSASVWLPARVDGVDDQVVPQLRSNNQNLMDIARDPIEIDDRFYQFPAATSHKYSQIRTAAVLACAPICPSRDLGIAGGGLSANTAAIQRMYRALVPSSASNGRIDPRLANKIAYSDLNTDVIVSWRDAKNGGGSRETYRSPTYNPRNHNNPINRVEWVRGEVGWQDAITIHIRHRFALLPGPGRLLAKHLVPASGLPDRVSSLIQVDRGRYSEPVYSVVIPASATATSEGMQSVKPYNQPIRQ